MTSYKYDYDVLIVGGGPAGSYLGYLLARDGIDVCIIDKSPRHRLGFKVCGEGMFRHCLESLNSGASLSLSILNTVLLSRIRIGDILVAEYWRPLYIINRVESVSNMISLAEKHGANVLCETEVLQPLMRNNVVVGARVNTGSTTKDIRARIVIDASGYPAVIRNKITNNIVRWKLLKNEIAIAYRSIIESEQEYPTHIATIYFDQKILRGGYLWIFPQETKRLNIGLGTTLINAKSRIFPHLCELLAKKICKKLLATGLIIDSGYGLIPVRRPFSMLVWNGVLLVGDAGAQVNPLHAGGICSAMRGSEVAASTIINALEFTSGTLYIQDLWDYSYRYNRTEGVKHAIFELARIFLERMDNRQLALLMMSLNSMQMRELGSIKRYVSIHRSNIAYLARPSVAKDLARIGVYMHLFLKLSRIIKKHYDRYPIKPQHIKSWDQVGDRIFQVARSYFL